MTSLELAGVAVLTGVMSRVTIGAPLDWAWLWSATNTPGGWLIQCTFERADREDGYVGRGQSRYWFVPEDATASAIVKTMFAAVKQVVEHEVMESFRLDGLRPFDPHHSVWSLTRCEADE